MGRWRFALAAGLLCALTLACVVERRLLFRAPVGRTSLPPARDDVRPLRLGGEEGVEAWYLPSAVRGKRSPALIFAHGNAELIEDSYPSLEVPRRWGMGVLMVEYPGYGSSGGSPSEASITQAMIDAYDFLAAQPEVDPARIMAHGRSLGGGAVCALARHRSLAALVLESTFTSVRAFAGPYGILGPLVVDSFDNAEVVESFRGPMLILHGTADRIVPVEHGRELARLAGTRAEFHELRCGHNNCPRPWPLVSEFLAHHGLLPHAEAQPG